MASREAVCHAAQRSLLMKRKAAKELMRFFPGIVDEVLDDVLDGQEISPQLTRKPKLGRELEEVLDVFVCELQEVVDGFEHCRTFATNVADEASCRIRVDVPNDFFDLPRPPRQHLIPRSRWLTRRFGRVIEEDDVVV